MVRTAFFAAFLLPLLLAARSYELPASGVRLLLNNSLTARSQKAPPVILIRKKDQAKFVDGKAYWLYRQTGGIWGSAERSVTLWEPRFAPYSGPQAGTDEECEKSFQPFVETMLSAWLGCAGFPEVSFAEEQHNSTVEVREGKISVCQYLFFVRSLQQKRFFLLLHDFSAPPSGGELAAIRKELLGTVFLLNRKSTPPKDRVGRAVAETLHMPNWWKSQSANYLFLSNVTDRSRIRGIQQDLERARTLFSLYLPLPKITEPGIVKFFGKREEYVSYAGKDMAWSAGFWDPGRMELVISPLSGKSSGADQEKFMRPVLFHEGFHQYLFHGMKDRNIPCFFNEGCAQFFEESVVRGGKRIIFLSEARLQFTRSALQKAGDIDLMQFCRQSHQAFYEDSRRDFNYGFAYALLYYLLQGAPAEKKKAYAAIPEKYLQAFRTADSPEAALQSAFAGVEQAALLSELKKFWASSRRIKAASRYVPRRRK